MCVYTYLHLVLYFLFVLHLVLYFLFVLQVVLTSKYVDASNNPYTETLDTPNPASEEEQRVQDQQEGRVGGKVLYSFIRRRTQNKSHSYGLTTVKELENGEIVEVDIHGGCMMDMNIYVYIIYS